MDPGHDVSKQDFVDQSSEEFAGHVICSTGKVSATFSRSSPSSLQSHKYLPTLQHMFKKKKKEQGRTKNNPHPNTNTKQNNSKNKTFLEVKCEVLFSL